MSQEIVQETSEAENQEIQYPLSKITTFSRILECKLEDCVIPQEARKQKKEKEINIALHSTISSKEHNLVTCDIKS